MVYVHLAQRGRDWIVIDPPPDRLTGRSLRCRLKLMWHGLRLYRIFRQKTGFQVRLYPTQEGIARASTEGKGS
jgi:hypothetical protein